MDPLQIPANHARHMVMVGKISEIRRRMHLVNRWLYLRETQPEVIQSGFWLLFTPAVNKNFVGTVAAPKFALP